MSFSEFSNRWVHRTSAMLAVIVGAITATAICAAADVPSATIEITKFAFAPKDITVAPGTRVQWVNHDEAPHTVMSSQGQPKVIASKAMDTDDRFELTLANEGDYSYYCTVHPFMTGVIHVRKQ